MMTSCLNQPQGLRGQVQAAQDVQRQIPISMEGLRKSIGTVHGLLAELETRLQPVIRREQTNGQGEKNPPTPVAQTLSEQIAGESREIYLAAFKVQELIRLIEL